MAKRRPSRERELAEMIASALEQIEGKRESIFVKTSRIMRRKSLNPTEHQEQLYRWIRRRGFVRRDLTLGMHWGMLGGLMARGLVYEAREHGEVGIRAR